MGFRFHFTFSRSTIFFTFYCSLDKYCCRDQRYFECELQRGLNICILCISTIVQLTLITCKTFCLFSVPKSEVGKFIGEEQPRIPSAQVDASASDVGGNANSQAAPSQGYFTSILSSIPNLSLPSAKVEPPAVQNPPVTHYPQSSGVYPHLSQPSLASNPYEIDPALRRPPLQKPPQSIAPPSGCKFFYRS